MSELRSERVPYGADPEQWGELWLPPDATPPWPVTVMLHGGFWRAPYTLDLMRPLSHDLARRGHAVWNLEYRRVGCPGGGWPGTLADVAAGIDALVEMSATWPLDLSRTVVVGHSAGGQLALWAAGRHRLPDGRPGAGPAVAPRQVVSLAGLSDLVEAADLGLGEGATVELLGGTPAVEPEAYAHASPIARLPTGVPTLLVHGDADVRVPVSLSQRYAEAAAAAGDDVDLLVYPGVDHIAVIDPSSAPWRDVVARVWP